jgi:hypothetical protein
MANKICRLVLLILLIISCQTVQQTGRSQFIVASESQGLQLGETLKKNRISIRNDWHTQLRRVGQGIAAAVDK